MNLIDRIKASHQNIRKWRAYQRFEAEFGGDYFAARPGLRPIVDEQPFDGVQIFVTLDPRWTVVTTPRAKPYLDDDGRVQLDAPHVLVTLRPLGKGGFLEHDEEFRHRVLPDLDYFSTEGIVGFFETNGQRVLTSDSYRESVDNARQVLAARTAT